MGSAKSRDAQRKKSIEPGYTEKKAAICAHARALFLRYGYKKTTMEDVGNACDLDKTSLYHYFSGKEELIIEVVRADAEETLRRLSESVCETSEPRVKLLVFFRTLCATAKDLITEITDQRKTSEFLAVLPIIVPVQQHYLEEQARILSKILEEGARQGVFRPVALPNTARLMVSAFRGIALSFFEGRESAPSEESLEGIMQIFMDGLCFQA